MLFSRLSLPLTAGLICRARAPRLILSCLLIARAPRSRALLLAVRMGYCEPMRAEAWCTDWTVLTFAVQLDREGGVPQQATVSQRVFSYGGRHVVKWSLKARRKKTLLVQTITEQTVSAVLETNHGFQWIAPGKNTECVTVHRGDLSLITARLKSVKMTSEWD